MAYHYHNNGSGKFRVSGARSACPDCVALDEERRVERNQRVFDQYAHYEEGPRGSEDQWRNAAAGVMNDAVTVEAEMDTHLRALGLDDLPTSSADLQRAYRRAALRNHPDKNPDDAKAEERFKAAAAAYEYLSDLVA